MVCELYLVKIKTGGITMLLFTSVEMKAQKISKIAPN